MYFFRIAAIVLAIAAGQTASAWAEVCSWTGASSVNWNDAANWQNCRGGVPQSGDAIVITTGTPNAASNNDIRGLSLIGIQMVGSTPFAADYEISGEPITLTGALTFNMPFDLQNRSARFHNTLTLGQAIVISNARAFGGRLVLDAVDLGGFPLTLSAVGPMELGAVSGHGALRKQGAAALTLSGASTYTGPTTIAEGGVFLSTSQSLGASGAGNGTSVQSNAFMTILDGVTLSEPLVLEQAGPSPVLGASGTVTLNGNVTLNNNNVQVASFTGGHLTFGGTITSAQPNTALHVSGRGTIVLGGTGHAWGSLVIEFSTSLRLAGPEVLPAAAPVSFENESLMDLQGQKATVGALGGVESARILLGGGTLTINQTVDFGDFRGTIEGQGHIIKAGPGALGLSGPNANTYTGTITLQAGILDLFKPAGVNAIGGALIVNGGEVFSGTDQIPDAAPVTINSPGQWRIFKREVIGPLSGSGRVFVRSEVSAPADGLEVRVPDGVTTFSGKIDGIAATHVVKQGPGTWVLSGENTITPGVRIMDGTLTVDGSLDADTSVLVDGGTLTGTGRVGRIIGSNNGATSFTVRPTAPGVLTANNAVIGDDLLFTLANGTSNQLRLTGGGLTLRSTARLTVFNTAAVPTGTSVTLVSATMPVQGTFSGLPQGAEITADGQRFSIDYAGGSGNDVVLTALDDPFGLTYFLAEGSTGAFFDSDVLLANPNRFEAPVKMTFYKENGQQVVVSRTLAPQSHAVIHVDEIPGLQAAAASAKVESLSRQELFVERTMFWGPTRYAGHTGSALPEPSPDWFFAEGAQGFFDTFVLIINPNATAADVTFTFLRENGEPVVKTVTVAGGSRRSVGAFDYPELASRAFGIEIHATQPVMAERAMYFASTPDRLWGGGHVSAGVTAPQRTWFLAEGATGDFFDTFILFSNPQRTPAQVQVKYLLWTGASITVSKTIAAGGRLTVNPETEEDERLKNAAFSTDITSDQPIIVERSMYWPGATQPWGEAHNSVAFVRPGASWGLAEGRLGGPDTPFSTYILLANPNAEASEVTATFLRDAAPPIVKTYTVPATGRFTIDCSTIPELHDSTFGVSIEVTNQQPIVVERSMYWDANGIFWSGGTNAPGILWNVP